MNIIEQLENLQNNGMGPCRSSRIWIRELYFIKGEALTPEVAWKECPRLAWLEWVIEALGQVDIEKSNLLKWRLVNESKPRGKSVLDDMSPTMSHVWDVFSRHVHKQDIDEGTLAECRYKLEKAMGSELNTPTRTRYVMFYSLFFSHPTEGPSVTSGLIIRYFYQTMSAWDFGLVAQGDLQLQHRDIFREVYTPVFPK